MIFRIFSDGTKEQPHRDAFMLGQGWGIELDRFEDLQGLAGYGGRVTVVVDQDDARIELTSLGTISERARTKAEATIARYRDRAEEFAATVRAVRSSDGSIDRGL